MKREIVKIDRDLCNGCGECIPNCHEGALQMIDDKATLVSELMCDGLGACVGHCPVGAITIEVREAEAYNETLVMAEMVSQGKNVVKAHLQHLKDHNQTEFLNEAVSFLKMNRDKVGFDVHEIVSSVLHPGPKVVHASKQVEGHGHGQCGCPGSKPMDFGSKVASQQGDLSSQLTQWPVQLHLINTMSGQFNSADLLLAADCVAFALGNFHQNYLKGKKLAIACPKLDNGTDIYIEKLVKLIDGARVNTITVMIMEVPCCGGLLKMVQMAKERAARKVPVKAIVVGIQGQILEEDWM